VLKKILLILLALLLVGGFFGYRFYGYIFNPNISIEKEKMDIHIPSNGNLNSLLDTLSNKKIIIDTSSFLWVADKMKFTKIKPGKYTIQNNWSNKDIISLLRSGRQSAVNLTFNNVRTIEELSGMIAGYIESDSLECLNYFTSQEVLEKVGLDRENIITLFIPNTYQIFWNQGPKKLIDRFMKEREKFWTVERLAKAKAIQLTKEEVYTLASIVQKESNRNSEKPIIAGVYLNRLERGILLQADPTAVFGVGDFTIRRVLNKHIQHDSPYNTYIYEGLPPGPIYMPDISSIDAVLNRKEHSYLYFCASTENNGKHAFAKTLTQHNANANKYRKWLNEQRIYK